MSHIYTAVQRHTIVFTPGVPTLHPAIAQLMEWQHMVVTREQNTAAKGYGQNRSTGTTRDARMYALFFRVVCYFIPL